MLIEIQPCYAVSSSAPQFHPHPRPQPLYLQHGKLAWVELVSICGGLGILDLGKMMCLAAQLGCEGHK